MALSGLRRDNLHSPGFLYGMQYQNFMKGKGKLKERKTILARS